MSEVHNRGGDRDPQVAPSRSRITAEIERLATHGNISHDEIAVIVRHRVPGSRTTAKSVASVIHALRRSGVEVPRRPVGPIPCPAGDR